MDSPHPNLRHEKMKGMDPSSYSNEILLSSSAQQQQQEQRQIQSEENGGPSTIDGTLTILILLIVIFCFIWSPSILRRCNPRYRERRRRQAEAFAAAREAEEAALRAVMEGVAGALTADHPASAVLPHGMTLEERREFVSNVLLSKKLEKLPGSRKEAPQTPSPSSRKTAPLTQTTTSSSTKPQSSSMEPSLQISNTASTETADGPVPDSESCAICLAEYKEGDDICWSHNKRCPHSFHRECIMEWLIRHDECPCCRHNYLALDDGDEETSEVPTTTTNVDYSSQDPETNSRRGWRRLNFLISSGTNRTDDNDDSDDNNDDDSPTTEMTTTRASETNQTVSEMATESSQGDENSAMDIASSVNETAFRINPNEQQQQQQQEASQHTTEEQTAP